MQFRFVHLVILLAFTLATLGSSPAEKKSGVISSESGEEQPAGPPGLGTPKVHYITPDVYAVTHLYHPAGEETGVSAGLIFTAKSIIFIDAGMSVAAGEYLWKLAEERMRGDEDLYLILTHRHSDHVFGMRVMEENGALVIAHPLVKEFFQARGDRYKQFIVQKMGWDPLEGEAILGEVVLSPPDRVVERDTVLNIDDDEIHVLATPGHGWDELSVYHPKSKVLFAGDAIYEGIPPHTAFGGPEEWRVWVSQLERLKKLEINAVVPGHGKLCDKKEIDRNIAYLQQQLDDRH